MSNVQYTFFSDGHTVYGAIPDGTQFCIDSDMLEKIESISFYRCRQGYKNEYLMDSKGIKLHEYLFPHKDGLEVDHINLGLV